MSRAFVVLCAVLGLAASAAIGGCDPVTGEQMRNGETVQVDTAVPSELKSCCDELDKEVEGQKAQTQVAANSAGSAYEPVYPAFTPCCGGDHGHGASHEHVHVHAAEAAATPRDVKDKGCEAGGCEKAACDEKADCELANCSKADCGTSDDCGSRCETAAISIEKPAETVASCCGDHVHGIAADR